MSDDRQNWSLRDEIKKRKQEQEAAARRTQQAKQPPPAAPKPAQPSGSSSGSSGSGSTTPPVRKTTTTGSVGGQTPPAGPSRRSGEFTPVTPSRATQRATQVVEPLPSRPSRLRRLLLIVGAIAGVLIVLSIGAILLLPGASTPTPEPTLALPRVTANDVVAYLRKAGVPISGLQSLEMPSESFEAAQALQFSVLRQPDQGFFMVLSYENDRLGLNAFSATNSEKWAKWSINEFSNILVLTSPESASPIRTEILSHIMTFMLGPYRAYVPTTTGTPIQIVLEATRIAATATATSQLNIVTLPPRTVEGFTPSPMVGALPSFTPRPTIDTATPTPTRTRGALFATLTPQAEPPTVTPQAGATEARSTTIPGGPTPTIDPASLSSAPTIAPELENSRSYNERVPREIGPFRLDEAQMTENQNGSTLVYITRDGQQFLVVLWITNSPQEAYERYDLDKQAIKGGYQEVELGDEGMITPPGNFVLAMTRYANLVLIIYRPMPGGTVPPKEIPQSDTLLLLTELFKALPESK